MTDDDGRRHEVRYPEGWEVRFEREIVLLGPTGEPYAHPGDRICVWGSPVAADAVAVAVPRIFEAVSVEGHFRRRDD